MDGGAGGFSFSAPGTAGGAAQGGGIYASGSTLNISSASTIENNLALGGKGASRGGGARVLATGPLPSPSAPWQFAQPFAL